MYFPRLAAAALLLAGSTCIAQPVQVAVLLPQSGRMAKAAETIRNGLLAAYYQDGVTATDSPSLRFYDSDNTDIVTLVKQARAEGATVVIGPLDRERVERLVQAGPPGIPVLTLNAVDAGAAGIMQFSLAPEDELHRVAAWMNNAGIRHPMILNGGDDAGRRQQKLFEKAWQRYHPGSLPVTTLDGGRKGGIVAGIHALAAQSGRHDAFFLASPALATQVQPALTYYHITLPLYALAGAWEPAADASGQKDLDGLRFCDLPWMLDDARPEQAGLYAAFPRPGGSYDRLYAFGADAWTLVRRWQSLLDGEALNLRSGRLQSDPTGHLHRTPTCAEVRNGTATPLWTPDGAGG